MIFYVAFDASYVHEFVRLNFAQPLNIDRSSIFVNAMVTLGIVLQNFLQLLKLKILQPNSALSPVSEGRWKNNTLCRKNHL